MLVQILVRLVFENCIVVSTKVSKYMGELLSIVYEVSCIDLL